MGEVIGILTSTFITPEKLMEYIVELGGYVIEVEGRVSGHFADKATGAHIMIVVDPSILRELREEDVQELEQVRKKLGGEPKTSIVVDISSSRYGYPLAVRFTLKFLEQWSGVVDTFGTSELFLTKEELEEIRNNKRYGLLE